MGLHLVRRAHSFHKVSVRPSMALSPKNCLLLQMGCSVEPVAFVPMGQAESGSGRSGA